MHGISVGGDKIAVDAQLEEARHLRHGELPMRIEMDDFSPFEAGLIA